MNENMLRDPELESIIGGADPGPAPVPTTDPGPIPAGDIAARAEKELGKPYAWGAVGPSAYDAPGLVSYCLTGVHARIGTTSTFMGWPRVSDPQPGDICTSSYHCGIYMGPNSMIHAPAFGMAVSYGSIQPDMIIVRRP